MSEFLICPKCRLACFAVHAEPATNPGVFTNRREALAMAANCPDGATAPCGRVLVRDPGPAEPPFDQSKCEYRSP